ncbi:hypothetical protein [uncultured Williamsia sp.]|uniref:hypothetical protein n=1 Tax=uncultured Williamsia sp. TaxID=259311 RepID=UPI00345B480B
MTLLRRTADELGVADPDSLVEQLLGQMLITRGYRASPSEQQSWRRSLPALASDLRSAGLGDVEMLIHLPLTSQRADVVLAGIHPATGQASYVVLELKQWSAATMFEGDPELVTVPGMNGGPKLRPVRQVQGYCSYLADFVRALADQPDALAGAAYLHNATNTATVADLSAVPVSTTGRLFTGAALGKFIEFLRSRLAPASGAAAADTLLRSAIAPSRQLLKVAADEVQIRERFNLLGDQQAAVQTVHHAVRKARAGNPSFRRAVQPARPQLLQGAAHRRDEGVRHRRHRSSNSRSTASPHN